MGDNCIIKPESKVGGHRENRQPRPSPTAVSGKAERRLIITEDESVPVLKKMDPEVRSAINRALLHQYALAHFQIMNATSIAKGAGTAITDEHAIVAMALLYHDVIITPALTVDEGIIDVEENESW